MHFYNKKSDGAFHCVYPGDQNMQKMTRPYVIRRKALVVAVSAVLMSNAAFAVVIDTGDSDITARFDNTIKYTSAYRLNNPSQKVAASTVNPNVDAGDLNLQKGLINNRIDITSEADINYKDSGFRVSGTGWYDTVYEKSSTDFPSVYAPNTVAAAKGGANNQYTSDAQKLMGNHVELLEAFIHNTTEVNNMQLSTRLGRLTQLYGESLFLGANAIAYAQGPVDLIKALSLPNAQYKDIALPVRQATVSLQVNPNLSFDAYNQFEWRPIRLPAAGSYFSPADFVGAGGDLILLPGGLTPASRGFDQQGRSHGQFGGRIKFKVPGSDVEYGLYAAQYDDKLPIPVVNLAVPGQLGSNSYNLDYGRDIKIFGASFSTLIKETNVAGEVSTRRNTPLAPLGDLIITANPQANNSNQTPYARGNTLHANLSQINVFPATRLYDGASLVAEFAFNSLLNVTHDPSNPVTGNALNTTHSRDHEAVKVVFQPEYFQVRPGLDLQTPITVGYGINGRSAVLQVEPEHGGEISLGINFDYMKTWRGGFQITHYYGPAGPAPSLNPATTTMASYQQYYHDRDFASFTIQRTF